MRLIDADALLEQIDIDSDGNEGQYGDEWLFIETIENAPTIEVPKWIPCSERLPKLGEKILVSTRKTCFVQVYKGIYSEPTRWAWEHRSIKEIIAWMPLPKPYKETDNE